MVRYISNSDHYSSILSHCKDVKHTLWIGTADIKDAYIEDKGEKMPFLKLMAQLIRKGEEIRLIHAKEPGPAFREDFSFVCLWVICHIIAIVFHFSEVVP